MFFIISNSDSTKKLANTTRVTLHLRNGTIEILDRHQNLMGKVCDDLVQVETTLDNKQEIFSFVVQDAIFIISTKGLEESASDKLGTTIYMYARRIEELNSQYSIDPIIKEYEEKVLKTEEQRQKQQLFEKFAIENPDSPIQFMSGTKLSALENDVKYLENLISIYKKNFERGL